MSPQASVSDSKPAGVQGGYDPGRRRRSVRKGREGGCWVYIPAAELRKVGLDTRGAPPSYRVWGGPRRGVVIGLYPPAEAFTDEHADELNPGGAARSGLPEVVDDAA